MHILKPSEHEDLNPPSCLMPQMVVGPNCDNLTATKPENILYNSFKVLPSKASIVAKSTMQP
jgi:hypothetical protein